MKRGEKMVNLAKKKSDNVDETKIGSQERIRPPEEIKCHKKVTEWLEKSTQFFTSNEKSKQIPSTSFQREHISTLEDRPNVRRKLVFHHQSSSVSENVFDDQNECMPFASDTSSEKISPTPSKKTASMSKGLKSPKSVTETTSQKITLSSSKKSTSRGIKIVTRKKRFSKKGDTRQIRSERKIKRNGGESYETKKKNEKRAKKCELLKPCRMKCKDKIDFDFQKSLFETYWSMKSRDRRANFISKCIEFSAKKSQRKRRETPEKQKNRQLTCFYYIPKDGNRVELCKKCFKQVFDETNKFIHTIFLHMQKSPLTHTTPDKRGKHTPKNKIQNSEIEKIDNFIKSLPLYESHYCRKTTEKLYLYLPSHYTLMDLYRNYCENNEKPIGRVSFSKILKDRRIKIKSPKKDTCSRCDILKMKLTHATEDEKSTLRKEQESHQNFATLLYDMKRQDCEIAKNSTEKAVFCFDLQQCLPTPALESSVVFYKRQLWTYNFTIHNMLEKSATHYVWYESLAKRGGNNIGSCLYHYLMKLKKKHVTLYSDCCAGQNKNSIIVAVCFAVLNHSNSIEIIDHKFMVSGHSRMECDSDHAVIENAKKRYTASIEHPHDWAMLIKNAKKTKPVFEVVEAEKEPQILKNFSSLLKTTLHLKKITDAGNKFVWQNIRWLRYDKKYLTFLYFKTNDDFLKEEFDSMKVLRRGKIQSSDFIPPQCYTGPIPIATAKKNDLITLLPFITPVYHDFYNNLPATEKKKDDDLISVDE